MKQFFGDIVKYYSYSVRSAKTTLKTEVEGSYLNWIWWILDPLFSMMIYAFIFGVVFNAKEEYFPIFIFIGLTMWSFFNGTSVRSVKTLKRNKAIVKNVYIPKFILLIENMMVNAFKMCISFVIVIIMMLFNKVPISWYIICIPIILINLFLLTFAVGVHFLHFGVFIEDLSNIVAVVFKLMFYLSGVIFDVRKRFPEPYGDYLIKFNPVCLFLKDMRNILLYQQSPDYKFHLIWAFVSMILIIIGVRRIYKNENSYVKVM